MHSVTDFYGPIGLRPSGRLSLPLTSWTRVTNGCPLVPDYLWRLVQVAMPMNLFHAPQGLGNTLDEAGRRNGVHHEACVEPLASCRFVQGPHIIDRQHDDSRCGQSDYNRLGDKLDEEIAYQ